MAISVMIKVRRKELGLSQIGLASMIGIHSQTVSDIERGKRGLPKHCIEKTAQALGMTQTEIVKAIDFSPRETNEP
jgi:transcriptional regulator with XRE-family HTH domain